MRYFDLPTPETQRKPLVPQKLISGMLPGATEIRIGGNENIKISGKDQRISVFSGESGVSLGQTTTTTQGFLVTDSQGVRRLLAGVFPDGSIKIKLSQATFDVTTATDDQLIWSSDFNSFKIVETGTTSIQGADNNVTFSSEAFDRTYSKPPIIMAYATVTDGSTTEPKLLPYINYIADGGAVPPMYGVYYLLDVGATTTEVTFTLDCTFNGTGSSVSAAIRYYVIQETAAAS